MRTILALVVVALTTEARAAEVAQLASGRPRGAGVLDVHVSAGWQRDARTASLGREQPAPGSSTVSPVAPDTVSRRFRHLLHLRAEAGVVRDVAAFLAAPLVLDDDRRIEAADGVTDTTLVRDRIVAAPVRGGPVFRGPDRRGLEHLALGGRWAPMRQTADETRAIWLLGLEGRLALGGDQRFDPARPTANRAVGPGYHQLIASTVFTRQFGALEPWLGGWYAHPFTKEGGPFDGLPGEPQRRAGAEAGLEVLAWSQPRTGQRLSLDVRGRTELRLAGLAQTDLWEPLSGASTCRVDPTTCRPGVDRTPGLDGPHPGVVASPAYGVFGAEVGVNVRVGDNVRFRAHAGLAQEQARFVTDGTRQGTSYDDPGRRFRVDDARTFTLAVDGGLMF